MTGKGERKLREWAIKRNGDPISEKDIVELVFAQDEDNEARHKETLALFEAHEKEARERDRRIQALEASKQDKEDHSILHERHMRDEHSLEAPRRSSDPPDSEFDKVRATMPRDLGEALMGWKALKWLLIVTLAALIVMLADQLGNIIFGGMT